MLSELTAFGLLLQRNLAGSGRRTHHRLARDDRNLRRLAHGVAQRRREIGIRVALGAQRWQVLGMVVRHAISLTGTGAIVGLAMSAGVAQLLTGFIFGISVLDPVSFLGSAFLLGAVALIASLVPARRAASVDRFKRFVPNRTVMLQDLRYALRSLSGRPLVTTVAVLSLALGIGVNTAMFSVFDRLLLRRLPVPAAHAIVNVTSPGPRPGSQSTGDGGRLDAIFSYPLFRDLERLDGDACRRRRIVTSAPTSPTAGRPPTPKACSCPATTSPPSVSARHSAACSTRRRSRARRTSRGRAEP